MTHPCLTCGACCATYRVSFHWSEADPGLAAASLAAADPTHSVGGPVPVELTEPFGPHRLAMRGTWSASPRCVALDAEIGVRSRCRIHPQRPSPCREVAASWEAGEPSPQCDKARQRHGLPVLTPADWAAHRPLSSRGGPAPGHDAIEAGIDDGNDAHACHRAGDEIALVR